METFSQFLIFLTYRNGHMLTHRNKKPYECKAEGCGKSYCDARSLRRHTENHHSSLAMTPTTPNQTTTGPPTGLSLSPATASGKCVWDSLCDLLEGVSFKLNILERMNKTIFFRKLQETPAHHMVPHAYNIQPLAVTVPIPNLHRLVPQHRVSVMRVWLDNNWI